MPLYLRRPPAVVPRVTEIGNGLSTVLPMLAGVLVPTCYGGVLECEITGAQPRPVPVPKRPNQ